MKVIDSFGDYSVFLEGGTLYLQQVLSNFDMMQRIPVVQVVHEDNVAYTESVLALGRRRTYWGSEVSNYCKQEVPDALTGLMFDFEKMICMGA